MLARHLGTSLAVRRSLGQTGRLDLIPAKGGEQSTISKLFLTRPSLIIRIVFYSPHHSSKFNKAHE